LEAVEEPELAADEGLERLGLFGRELVAGRAGW
jgi:hypothetical protein